MPVKAFQGRSAFLAAAISCALGVAFLVHPDRSLPRVPPWEGLIAPLASAPLSPGTSAALLAQLGVSDAYNRFLLLEAAWRRPDVRWTPMLEFPLDSHYDTVVTTDARSEPPGWSKTWGSGRLRLFRRTPR